MRGVFHMEEENPELDQDQAQVEQLYQQLDSEDSSIDFDIDDINDIESIDDQES